MTIKLITESQYVNLVDIQNRYPKLTFQNKGYQYLNMSSLNKEETDAFEYVRSLCEKHIEGFSKLEHFKIGKDKEILLRIQYAYSPFFTGVGYIDIGHLWKGFPE